MFIELANRSARAFCIGPLLSKGLLAAFSALKGAALKSRPTGPTASTLGHSCTNWEANSAVADTSASEKSRASRPGNNFNFMHAGPVPASEAASRADSRITSRG